MRAERLTDKVPCQVKDDLESTRQNYQASTSRCCTSMVCSQDSSGRWLFTTFQQPLRKWSNVPWANTSGDDLVLRPVSLTMDSTGRQQTPIFALEEFMVSKTRLVLTLRDSRDQLVSQAEIETRTGRKWSASQAVEQAETRLKHLDIVEITSKGRMGLGNRNQSQWKHVGPWFNKKLEIWKKSLEKTKAVQMGK